jgi:hypothetical protein
MDLISVVDRHRFDNVPDPVFHFDANPGPDPDWHQNDTVPIHMRILPQILHPLENKKFFLTFSVSIASLQCFILLISVKGVIIFSILDSILVLKFSGKS